MHYRLFTKHFACRTEAVAVAAPFAVAPAEVQGELRHHMRMQHCRV